MAVKKVVKNIVYLTRYEEVDVSIWKADIFPIYSEKEDTYFFFDNAPQKVTKDMVKNQEVVNAKNSISRYYIQENNQDMKKMIKDILTNEKRPDKKFVLIEEKHGELK